MVDLNGKVAIITGGSRGIGRVVAEKLASVGATIILSDILDDGISAAKEISEKYSVETLFIKTDVTDLKSVEALSKEVIEKFGKIDILINNAGITRDKLFLRMKEEDFDKVIDVNLKGVFNASKSVFRSMVKQRGGNIVNISSVVGIAGNIGQVNYSASKAGVIGMTKSLAREGAKANIRVNAVAPGFIKTSMTKALKEEDTIKIIENIPMGEMGSPDDVANVVLFFASNMSKYITGQVLTVAGGMVI